MKRMTTRTAALALCLMLAGGVCHAEGVSLSGFLQREAALPADFGVLSQTDLAQQGGDLPNVTATVREAVSDGIGLFVVVEFKAKNPRDIVLLTWHADGLQEAMPEPRLLPHWGNMHDDQTRIYVDIPAAYAANGVNLITGYDWSYQGTDTLCLHYILDLRRAQQAGDPFHLLLKSAEYNRDDQTWYETASSDITVDVRVSRLETRRYVAQTPILFDNLEVTNLEVTATPLATYTTVHAVRPDSSYVAESLDSLLDAQGEPFTRLASALVSMPSVLQATVAGYGPAGQSLDMICAATNRSLDTVTLRTARPHDNDTHSYYAITLTREP